MLKSILTLPFFFLPLLGSADQRIIADSLLPADFSPVWVTPQTSDGFWALGTSNTLAALVRYNVDGSVKFLRYPSMQDAQSFKLTAMPDGGVVSTDIETVNVFSRICMLRRFDANGNQLWVNQLAQSSGVTVSPPCSTVYIDGTGSIWLYPSGLNANYIAPVNADGAAGPQIARPSSASDQMVADPVKPAVYVVGATNSSDSDPANTLATVWKITAQGPQWSSSAPAADVGSVLGDIAVGADGSLWAFGQKGLQLYGMHVAADGSLLWSGAFDTAVTPSNVRVAVRADGGVSILHWDTTALESQQANSAPELSTFSAAGVRLWHTSSALSLPAHAYLVQLKAAAAQNGDVTTALLYYADSQPGTNYYLQQTRLDGNGSALFMTSPQIRQSARAFELEILPDDSSLTITSTPQRLTRNGGALALPQTAAITTRTSFNEDSVIAADGSTYLLTTNPSGKLFGVSAYSSTGALRWHTPVASSWSNGGLVGEWLLLRSNDACIAGYLDGDEIVQCFARSDGTASPRVVLASSIPQASTASEAVVTNADQIVLLYRSSDGSMHHALIDAANHVLHDVTPLQTGETWGGSAQNINGETAVVTSTSSVLKLAADGTRLYAVPTDLAFSGVALAADGSAILVTYSSSSPPQLERIDASGNRLWQNTMPPGPYNSAAAMRFTANDVYFTLTQNLIFGGGHPVLNGLVVKQALADGAIEWSSPLTYVFANSPRLVLDSNNAAVLTFSGWGNMTRVQQFAMPDGTLRGGKLESCGVDQCLLERAIIATDGTLRLVHDTTDYFSGSAFELTTMQNEFDKVFANGFDL